MSKPTDEALIAEAEDRHDDMADHLCNDPKGDWVCLAYNLAQRWKDEQKAHAEARRELGDIRESTAKSGLRTLTTIRDLEAEVERLRGENALLDRARKEDAVDHIGDMELLKKQMDRLKAPMGCEHPRACEAQIPVKAGEMVASGVAFGEGAVEIICTACRSAYKQQRKAVEEAVRDWKAYAELLQEAYDGILPLAHVHGFRESEERIQRGKELRTRLFGGQRDD